MDGGANALLRGGHASPVEVTAKTGKGIRKLGGFQRQ